MNPFPLFRRAALLWAAGALLALLLPAGAGEVKPSDKTPPAKKPKVEVVFCLDTTGSMGGLIAGAKQKIWSIANQIAAGKPTPALKIGLLGYRDRGDVYVTKIVDLSDDLDAIHGELLKFQAVGGGDTPESVNQALDDAVNKIKWSPDKDTLKIIFLVGDAPPHMDYTGDVKYLDTCKKAAQSKIIINTVQCGNDPECRKFWQEICAKAEGTYVQIAQEGGVLAVATPFDKRLGEINSELARGTVVYGGAKLREETMGRLEKAAALPAPAAADRASFFARSGRAAGYDLIDALKDKKVKLEDLKTEELPEDMRKMTPAERKAYLEKLEKRRAELGKEALDLDKKRSNFIQEKLAVDAKKTGKTGFDSHVVDTLRRQAARYNIKY